MVDANDQLLSRLGWRELRERSWTELVEHGLPRQLADLSADVGERNRRPIRVYTLPTVQAGIASLAVPFTEDDGIMFDPLLLDDRDELTTEVARGLAYTLYPGWGDTRLDDYDQMNAFAAVVSRILLRKLPMWVNELDPTVELTLRNLRAS
jgi:hypothetical protein